MNPDTSDHNHVGVMSRMKKPPARAGLDTARAGTAAAIRLVTCGGTAWFGPVWHGAAAS